MAAALGFAWGELGEWTEAVTCLETALRGAKSDCPLRVIEQCANFRVRKAAAQWKALRDTSSPADLEAPHRDLVKAIQKAIDDLETLAEYGKTRERLTLLGGSWKRLAFVQTEQASRAKALSETARYYKDALDHSKDSDAYAWTNWAAAELLSARFDQADAATWSKKSSQIEAQAPRLKEALQKDIETNPNFWNYAGLADVDLVRLIAAYPIIRARTRRSKESAESEALGQFARDLKSAVIKGYQTAIMRGGSPREKGSVIENLDFVLEIIENQKDPLTEAIKDIRENLQPANS